MEMPIKNIYEKLIRNLAWFALMILLLSSNITSSQSSHFALGGGIAFNMSPYQYFSKYEQNTISNSEFKTNFSPVIIFRYGKKLSGIWKMSYIQSYYRYNYWIHVNGGTGAKITVSNVEQIPMDFLFQYTIHGDKGLYLLMRISTAIPIRIKNSITTSFTGVPPEYEWQTYEENYIQSPYFVNLQAVGGIGGYIKIKDKNAICIEGNVRYGIIPVCQTTSDVSLLAEKSRTLSIQIILGYLRHFEFRSKVKN